MVEQQTCPICLEQAEAQVKKMPNGGYTSFWCKGCGDYRAAEDFVMFGRKTGVGSYLGEKGSEARRGMLAFLEEHRNVYGIKGTHKLLVEHLESIGR